MSPEWLNGWAAQWAPCMLRACWQGALAAVGVWVVCRLFRRLPPSLRAVLWWLVCLKTLIGVAVTGPLHLAVLPARPAPPVVVTRHQSAPALLPVSRGSTLPAMDRVGVVTAAAPLRAAALPERRAMVSPVGLVMCLWLAGVLLLLASVCRELHAARRLAAQAAPCDEAADIWEVTRAVGLTRSPRVLVSERADCSVVIGPWRPAVVLSGADMGHLSRAELRALLAHELVHIRRRDLWAGMVPNLARLLFFFDPLVWLACREYDLAREATCDAEALRVSGLAPADYGRLLLKLSVAPATRSPYPAMATLGAASPYGALLRRRLQGLRNGSPVSRWAAALALATAGGALLLNPVRVGARAAVARHSAPSPKRAASPVSVFGDRGGVTDAAVAEVSPSKSPWPTIQKEDKPMSMLPKPKLSRTLAALALVTAGTTPALFNAAPAAGQDTPPPVPVAPVVNVAPVIVKTPVAVKTSVAVKPQVAVTPIAVSVPVVVAVPQDAPVAVQAQRYQYTLRRGDSYMVHTQDKGVGSAQRALAKAQPGDCLVVDRDGKRYLITDADTLKRIQENYAQVEAIGKQMESKGKQMEELAKPMEEFGKLMEATFGKQMEALGKQMEELGKEMEAAKTDDERKAIGEKMKAVGEKFKAPKEEMKALGEKMKAQGAKMKPLGEEMREVGNKIRAAVKEADGKMTGILDDAFAKNLAVEQK